MNYEKIEALLKEESSKHTAMEIRNLAFQQQFPVHSDEKFQQMKQLYHGTCLQFCRSVGRDAPGYTEGLKKLLRLQLHNLRTYQPGPGTVAQILNRPYAVSVL